MKRKMKWVIVVGLVGVLSGCTSAEEKKIVEEEKRDFNLLYRYEDDKLRPVVEKEKTPEELVEEIVLEELGMDTGGETYKEYGVLKGQGLFIESAIREGTTIPRVSAVPYKERKLIRGKDEVSEQKKKEEFAELITKREEVLKEQYLKDKDEKQWLLDELQRRLEKQEQGNFEKEDGSEDSWGDGTVISDAELEELKRKKREEMEKKKEAERLVSEKRKQREKELNEKKLEGTKKDVEKEKNEGKESDTDTK